MPAADLDLTGIDGYALRHLGHHLYSAGRAADLHRLLALEQQAPGGRAVNVWFAAHEQVADVLSYAGDLSLARADAVASSDCDLRDARPPASLGREIRYALVAASISSSAANIYPELLGHLVRAGAWSPQRGLDHARRLADPRDQVDSLLSVRPYAGAEESAAALRQAFATATVGVADAPVKADMLCALAPHLPAGLLAGALDAADELPARGFRSKVLCALAPHLPEHLLARALDSVGALDDSYRASALCGMAPYLPAGLLTRALDIVATEISPVSGRVQALCALVPRLPDGQRDTALAQAREEAARLSLSTLRRDALRALAPCLPARERAEALAQALEDAMADDFNSDDGKARALCELAPHLPAGLLARALEAAATISSSGRASVLCALAPRLPESLLPQVLDAVMGDSAGDWTYIDQESVLCALAPYLPESLIARVLEAVTGDSDEIPRRAGVLCALAPYLPESLLARALDGAARVKDPGGRVNVLCALVPRLDAERRAPIITQLLDAAGDFSDSRRRAYALCDLAACLPGRQLAEALAATADAMTAIADGQARAEALGALAVYLPDRDRAAVLAQALAAATAIADASQRASAVGMLVRYLPEQQQEATLAVALDAAAAIADASLRAAALSALLPSLPDGQRGRVVAQALDAIDDYKGLFNNPSRDLGALAPYVPGELAGRALDAAAAISPAEDRVGALAALAPYLPSELLGQALDLAATTLDESLQGVALDALAPHLRAGLVARALDIARAMRHNYYRALTLGRLSANVSGELRLAVYTQAMEAATAVDGVDSPADALRLLAPVLPASLLRLTPGELLDQVLDANARRGLDEDKARVLCALAPHLPPELLAKALGSLSKLSESERVTVLGALAPYLPDSLLGVATDAATALIADSYRAEALGVMASRLPAEQQAMVGTQALDAAAITDYYSGAKTLIRLAAHLPANLYPRALDIATANPYEDFRVEALAGLTPYLPASLAARALSAVPGEYPEALAALVARSREAPAHDAGPSLATLIRTVFAGQGRKLCNSVIATIAPMIAEVGGVHCVQQCAQSVADVSRWWP